MGVDIEKQESTAMLAKSCFELNTHHQHQHVEIKYS